MSAVLTVRPVKRMLRAAGTRVLGFASRAYVPGPHLHDAMRWAQRMDRRGVACTFGYFDGDQDTAGSITAQDRAAIDGLATLERLGYVSFKVPSLRYDARTLEQLAAKAEQRGQLIHFDSHGPETATPTIEALARLVAPGRRLSLSVPSRWARSRADADWAIAAGVRVRVVKGQWACPEQPTSSAASEADAAAVLRADYLALVKHLAGRATAVAIATHDPGLARESLTLLKAAGTPCELELLCGLPRRQAMAVAAALGVPVRLYIPFGQAWLPYALDQAVRSPKMLWWMLRDTFNAFR